MNISRLIFLINRFTIHPRYMFNRMRQASEYLGGVLICQSLPNFITLELSNHCNLKCSVCPREKMTRRTGNMDFSLFCGIVDQVKDFVEVIDLDLYGEFAYNPRWADMIGYAHSSGLFTVLNTNATLFDDEIIDKLVNSGIDLLTISFDGASLELYEKIRIGARYEKTLDNIMRFIRKNRSIYTILQMIRTTETIGEIDNFRKAWNMRGVDVVRIKEYMPFDPQKEFLDPDRGKKKARKPDPCLFLWKNLVVCQDGLVVPCCVDFDEKYILGDAKSQKIREIWNDEPLRALREAHVRRDFKSLDLCRNCHPLNINPILLFASSFADDTIRRKILPFFK